jgi:hypothetical protein
MAKLKEFSVGVRFPGLEVGINVQAESLEQAIAKARGMEMHEILGDYDDLIDGAHAVYSVWEVS